jgi:predicted O-methyltransferase YrrM
MDSLLIALLLLVLAGIAGLGWFSLVLYKKQRRNSEKVIRELNKVSIELKKSINHTYYQSEAYAQLIQLLDFKASLPATRGWAASPDLLLTIYETISRTKPSLVVELGSGVSTLVAAKSGARKVVSLDGSKDYAEKTREMLKEHRVRGVDVRFAALLPYVNGLTWYDISTIKDLKKIDLLIVDGPPGNNNAESRYPALKEFKDKLSPKAIVILDDVKREGERKLAEDFAAALPNHELTILDHEKGTAIISPR